MAMLPVDMARQLAAERQAEVRRTVAAGRRHGGARRHPALVRRAGHALIAAGRLLTGPEPVAGEPLWRGSSS
jgi:hypothetical protein